MGMMINRRRVYGGKKLPYDDRFVDLGLPSGTLWATKNIGANTETDYGLYFAWGETTGYADAAARNTALGRTDGFSDAAYKAGSAASISTDLTLENDAAHAYLGGECRMPTRSECEELNDNCTSVWTTENGVNGRRFTSNINGNSIFLPAAGLYNDTSLGGRGSLGGYWLASRRSYSNGYDLRFNSGNVYPQYNDGRRYGFSVRAVKSSN